MESLFNYGSEEENDDTQEKADAEKAESDTNYDHVTMDMSDDSSSSLNGDTRIVTDRICDGDGVSGDHVGEAGDGDKSSGFSSSDSCCSSTESDYSSIREKLYQKQRKNNKSSSDYKSYLGDKYNDNKLHDTKRLTLKRTSQAKGGSKDVSGHDSEEADSEEDEEDDAKYRDREGRIRDRDRDRKRHRSRSRERSHTHDRHRSRSPTSDRHHSSKHYSHRSRHSMSRERDSRSRNRSRSREKSRSYDNKRQNKLTILEKLGIELKVPDQGSVTPQLALQKTMEDQITRVKNATGISLPSYYNPIAVNPTKYAEQMQKRKLLWGGAQKQNNNQSRSDKDPRNTGAAGSTTVGSTAGPASLWQGARFSQDQDGKLTAKFKRLMGIKQNSGEGSSGEGGTDTDLIKKQEEMFNSMEMQYEVARVATHTHRGLGLGFGVHQYPR